MAENITSTEYSQFLELKEQMTQAMQSAESEFMFQTYKKILAMLTRRHDAATKLNIILENAAIRELAKQKRASFQSKKTE